MQSIIQEAMEYTDAEEITDENNDFGDPRIFIVGCGGAGNNSVKRLYHLDIEGAETICINTDKQDLDRTKADKKILIGKNLTKGLGAGGYPDMGKKAAELAKSTLEEQLKDADLVFITAGMGGGTGTGSAPVVAEIAKDQGAIVVGMVSAPFNVERARKIKAEEGLEKLREKADTVIVLDNNKLLEHVPSLPMDKAFSVMDQLIAETIKGITETITVPSLINLDYADVKSIMKRGGVATMLFGESKAQNASYDVVKNALNHPLLDIDYEGATGCLIHITGGPDMSLEDANSITSNLTFELSENADVIMGSRVNPEFEGKIRVMAIMTGIKSGNQKFTSSLQAGSKKKTPSNPYRASPSAHDAKTNAPSTMAMKKDNDKIIDYI